MLIWEQFSLFLYVTMRISGFILFNPALGRQSMPALVKSGIILVFSCFVTLLSTDGVAAPESLVAFSVTLVMELAVGFMLGVVMQFFFSIPQVAGQIIDTQMGMTMGTIYDPGTQANITVSGTLLNSMMYVLFFVSNGHHTLIRILLTSGDIIPYGEAVLGQEAANAVAMLFAECFLLAVKLSFPIMAAELMCQVGMGILMKAIPQINIFSISIELKIIVALVLIFLLLTPIREFLLETENFMLNSLQALLETMH